MFFFTEIVPPHGLPVPAQTTGAELATMFGTTFANLADDVYVHAGLRLMPSRPVTRKQAKAALTPYDLEPVRPYLERLRFRADAESICRWLGVEVPSTLSIAHRRNGEPIRRGLLLDGPETQALFRAIGDPNLFVDAMSREMIKTAKELAALRAGIMGIHQLNRMKRIRTSGRANWFDTIAAIPPPQLPKDLDPNNNDPELRLARIGDYYVLMNPEQAVLEGFEQEPIPAFGEALSEPNFEFPSTDVYETRSCAINALDSVDWVTHGLLALSGYRVGRTDGKPSTQRRRLLNFIFLVDDLRYVKNSDYAAEWGLPKSSKRLQKMAESIAAFTRNAKRRKSHAMEEAVGDWEEDLVYLKETFYDRWGDFPWPTVSV